MREKRREKTNAKINIMAPPVSTIPVSAVELKTPFTMLVVGSSGAGKSTFVENLIEKGLFDRPLSQGEVYYFYNTDAFGGLGKLPGVKYIRGLPGKEWVETHLTRLQPGKRVKVPLIVIDDFGGSITMDTASLFTIASHHIDVNIICILHTLYSKNPAYKLMNDNSKYLVLFKNPRDLQVVTNLAKQMDPQRNRRFVSIFKEATERPHSYLLLDLHQSTPEKYRFRSNVLFENDEPMAIYHRK